MNKCFFLVNAALSSFLGVVSAFGSWTPAESRPDDAILLLGTRADGTFVNHFLAKEGTPTDWKVEDGALVSTQRPIDAQNPVHSNHTFSKETFRDAEIHVEFMVSPEAGGNSGVYIHGNYELQIMNSIGCDVSKLTAGAIYGIHPPKVNAAKPAGVWQTYDILYCAPRRDADGKIIKKGKITAYLNGELVQENAEFEEPVSHYHPFRYGETQLQRQIWAEQIKTGYGPLFLQDHGSPTKFRNVWIRKVNE